MDLRTRQIFWQPPFQQEPRFWAEQLRVNVAPFTATATRSALGASLSGTAKWTGGVAGIDGKIYGIPFNSTDILIIDPVAGTATRSALGASLSGSGKWFGGVAGIDGKIYGIPLSSTDILTVTAGSSMPLRLTMQASTF